MNKVTLAFATSTVGLAVAAGSLWKQLDAERDRAQVAAQQRGQLQARLAKLEHERHPTPAPNTATTAAPSPRIVQAASATARPDAAGDGDIDPIDLYNIQQQKRRQEARRRMLEEPRERELLKTQARSEARAANADLARELQLTDGEYDRLIERLAELFATSLPRISRTCSDTRRRSSMRHSKIAARCGRRCGGCAGD